jgi:hypothetical protein
VIFLAIAPGCKEEKPAKAVITVVDTLNNPIQGCTVDVNSDNNPRPGDVKATEITDVSGRQRKHPCHSRRNGRENDYSDSALDFNSGRKYSTIARFMSWCC